MGLNIHGDVLVKQDRFGIESASNYLSVGA
jgi:hypothetical protein